MHINESPDQVQPTTAVMATFNRSGPLEIEEIFTSRGVDSDDLWLWSGEVGRSIYLDRAPGLIRFFDDSEDFVTTALGAGRSVVLIDNVTEERANAVQAIASEGGADGTVYFGDTTHTL